MYVPLLHRIARPAVLHNCILYILFEGHGIGADDPLKQKNPAGHISGAADNPPVGHMRPPGHGSGTDNPSTGQMEPTGQILGALNPVTGQYELTLHGDGTVISLNGQYEPRGHGVGISSVPAQY